MGQKVNPISNRLGIVRGWDSNWYGGKDFGDALLEDSKIRKYLNARLGDASISRIVIERTLKLVTITVCTARPGLIIGKGGEKVDKLKEELKKCGILEFTEHMEKLANIWLKGEKSSGFYEDLFQYMMDSGIYGKDENGIWNKFAEEKKTA